LRIKDVYSAYKVHIYRQFGAVDPDFYPNPRYINGIYIAAESGQL